MDDYAKTGISPGGVGKDLPDFPSDLNAVHELEMKLTNSQKNAHGLILEEVCTPGLRFAYPAMVATALQRCESLIRTLNLWEEE
jgi:hypothetical protein